MLACRVAVRSGRAGPPSPEDGLRRASLRSPLALRAKTGGSGGARTRHKSNEIKGGTGLPSQIASQVSGLPGDLRRVIDAWSTLSQPLKDAIVAIVRAAKGKQDP